MIEFTFHLVVKPVDLESQKMEHAHMLSLNSFFCAFFETVRAIRFIPCTGIVVAKKRQASEYSEPYSGIRSEQLNWGCGSILVTHLLMSRFVLFRCADLNVRRIYSYLFF